MSRESLYPLLADLVLVTHLIFVLFVVLGLFFIYLGYFLNWSWVRRRIFRLSHLLAIGIVVIQSWLGLICPLTNWEMSLRAWSGEETYSGSFVQHWVHGILYYQAPDWVFTAVYTVFGGLVALGWLVVRPD